MKKRNIESAETELVEATLNDEMSEQSENGAESKPKKSKVKVIGTVVGCAVALAAGTCIVAPDFVEYNLYNIANIEVDINHDGKTGKPKEEYGIAVTAYGAKMPTGMHISNSEHPVQGYK